MKKIFFIVSFFIGFMGLAQNLDPFKIYTASGKAISNKKFLRQVAKADIILFGELHDNSIAHWIELQLVKQLYKKNKVVIGMEMFETDNQVFLDEYLNGKISDKQLETLVRLWSNYKTDYKPIVDFCKEKNLPVIATNIPRRYANILFKKGEEALISLPESDKKWFPTLPMPYDPNLAGYIAMLTMFADETHANANFPKSQAIKDYTMANFILRNYKSNTTFIHFNGSYHSNNFEGIYWYLKKEAPELNILTIATALQPYVYKLESKSKNIANYIIVTDSDVMRSF